VVYDPRLKQGRRNRVIDDFVLNIDIAPTIISAAGSDIPGIMQGMDFSELYLLKNTKKWRKDFYYEHPFVTSETRIPSSEALVTHTSKYIFWPHYQYEEYFDLEKDPMEKNNLINQRGAEGKIDEMKSRFDKLKSRAQ